MCLKLMGGLYPVASKFWAHCKVNPAPRKTLLFVFYGFFQISGFPKADIVAVLNTEKKKLKRV